MQENIHIECISDFCGNHKHCGAWADIYQRPDGSQYIALGGGWSEYAEHTPETIDQSSPHFEPFKTACDKGEDFGYVKEHFSRPFATVSL